MDRVNKLLLFLAVILCGSFVFQWPAPLVNAQSQELRKQLDRLNEDISQIRRDQLNYKIEKDLLKETYSSNLQTINIVITLLLSVFGILGFLGLRDVGTLKREYTSELDRLRGLQKDMEQKANEIISVKEEIQTGFAKVTSQAEEHNLKIKVLEIKEKVQNLQSTQQYQRALEYTAIALQLVPKDIELLHARAISYFKLGQYSEAESGYKKILEIEPDNFRTPDSMAALDGDYYDLRRSS